MTRYVALLRGINVGGRNVIPMADLRACFEGGGFADVTTYIQSGNVLLTSADPAAALTDRIEELLRARFDYRATVVLRSRTQMRAVVERAPSGFGSRPDRERSDVLFLKAPLTAAAALREVSVKDGVDTVHPGPGVVYASRLISKAWQSKLSRLAALPIYQQITVRNWNTTRELLALLL